MDQVESTPTHQEIACQQVLVDDASVFSVQWTVFPAMIMEGFSPENLLERYLAFIRDGTITIIRPLVLKTGVEFRLFGTNCEPYKIFAGARSSGREYIRMRRPATVML